MTVHVLSVTRTRSRVAGPKKKGQGDVITPMVRCRQSMAGPLALLVLVVLLLLHSLLLRNYFSHDPSVSTPLPSPPHRSAARTIPGTYRNAASRLRDATTRPVEAPRWISAATNRKGDVNTRRSKGIKCWRAIQDEFGSLQRSSYPTMVSLERLTNIVHVWSSAISLGIPGDWIETGTWKGGCSLLAADILRFAMSRPECPKDRTRTVWLADTFEGLPPPRKEDEGKDRGGRTMDAPGSYGGYGGVETVKKKFRERGYLIEEDGSAPGSQGFSLKFLVGRFNDTLPLANVSSIAVLRLDGDMYSSTMDGLTWLFPKVVKQGYVIIDDYGHWIQCKRAFDEYMRAANLSYPLHTIDYTGRWFQKQ
eukprot:746226-Hanusia_phi.AAC.3